MVHRSVTTVLAGGALALCLAVPALSRTKGGKGPSPAPPAAMAAAGQKIFQTHNCPDCHAVAGQGGAVGPALDDVAHKLTQAQIVARLQGDRKGSDIMPQIEPPLSKQDIQELTAYLLTLKKGS